MDEKMLAMFKEKERQNRFTTYNHIEMVMIEQDHAIFRLNICIVQNIMNNFPVYKEVLPEAFFCSEIFCSFVVVHLTYYNTTDR